MNQIRNRGRIGSGLPGSPMIAGAGPGVGPERPDGASRTSSGRLSRAASSSRSSNISGKAESGSKAQPRAGSKLTARKSHLRDEGA